MKKTFTVNISGIVFHIDEDAYEKLNKYLASIRKHFSTDDGCDEIIAGIESRIAEMFQEKTKENKQVITLEDVREVIHQLGEPEQISGEESGEKTREETRYTARGSKRLYRDPDDKYIGGVCGGLGAFFQIDPTWVRIFFLIGLFAGFGVLLYLVLWIVIPAARTTAEKLEMRGEKVNISSIERSIKEDLQDIKANLRDITEETRDAFKKKSVTESRGSGFRSFIVAFVGIVGAVLKIIGGLIGFVIVITGMILLTALITALFFGPVSIHSPIDAWLFSFPHFFDTVFTSGWLFYLATISLVITLGIPLAVLVYTGLKLIFDFKINIRHLGAIVFFIWITGLALALFTGLSAAREFAAHRTVNQEIVLNPTGSDTLYLDLIESDTSILYEDDYPFIIFGKWDTSLRNEAGIIQGVPRLRVRHHDREDILMNITRESRGATYGAATRKVENIVYHFEQTDSLIRFSPFYSFDHSDGWRVQKVYIELMLPRNKKAEPSRNLKRWLL